MNFNCQNKLIEASKYIIPYVNIIKSPSLIRPPAYPVDNVNEDLG